MFKSILIPVDTSPYSQGAAMLGLEFAKALQAKANIVHVLHQPPMYILQSESMTEKSLREHGEQVLEPWPKRAASLGVPCETRLIEEQRLGIGGAIAHAASELGCDLIVMGTQGREGLGRVFLGSVAERVTRLAKQPVMLVRRSELHTVKPKPFERLLVPVDGSDTSAAAIWVAHDLAKQVNACLDFLHVVPDLSFPVGDPVGAYAAFDYAGLLKSLEESGRDLLEQAMKRVEDVPAKSSMIPAAGERISGVIVNAAKERNADLIVMGTHGRGGFDRLLLGSVAEGVTHHAEVPVLLVRGQEKPAA